MAVSPHMESLPFEQSINVNAKEWQARRLRVRGFDVRPLDRLFGHIARILGLE